MGLGGASSNRCFHEALDASSSSRAARRSRGSDLSVVTDRPEGEHGEMRRSQGLMGLSGASLNQDILLRLSELNSIRERRTLAVPLGMSVAPHRNPIVRPLPVTRTVEQILVESSGPLRRAEVQKRVEQVLAANIPRSTVKSALINLAALPSSRVQRIDRGIYSVE